MVFGGDPTFLEVPCTATLDGLEGQATYHLKHSLMVGVWTFPRSGENNQTFLSCLVLGCIQLIFSLDRRCTTCSLRS